MKMYIDINLRKKYVTSAIILISITLAGCSNYGGPNEEAGTILGGVLGGIAGKQVGKGDGRTVAIIAGTLIGSHIGGSIGRSMDDTDRLVIARSLETGRTNVPTTWRNPDSNNQYTVTPTRTYKSSTGPCREYTVNAIIDGKNEKIYGKACRQADGSWRVQS